MPESHFRGVSYHTRDHRWQATLSITDAEGRRKQYTKQAPTELACVLAYNRLVRLHAPLNLEKLHNISEDGAELHRRKRAHPLAAHQAADAALNIAKRVQPPNAKREVIDLTASPPLTTGHVPFAWQKKLRAKRSAAAKGKRRTKYTAAENRAIMRLYAAAVAEGAGRTKRAVWDAVRDAMHALADGFPQRKSQHYRDHYDHVLSVAAVAKKATREAARHDVVYLLVVDLDPPLRAFSAHEDAALLAWVRRERGASASAASLAVLDAWRSAARSSTLRALGRAPHELWRQYWFAHAAYVGETPTLAARLRQHNCEQSADACVTRRVLPLLRSVEPRARWRHALTVRGFPRSCAEEGGATPGKRIPRKVFEYFWLHEKSVAADRPGRWRLRTQAGARRAARHTQVQGRMSECTYEMGRAAEELAKTLERFRDDFRTAAWGARLTVEWHIPLERRPLTSFGSGGKG